MNIAQALLKTLEEKSAIDPVYIDLAGKSDIADGMIVATGTSNTHRRALSDYIAMKYKELGSPILSESGREAADWILVDSSHVIVHIFSKEMRENYQIEKMWQAGEKIRKSG